MLTFIELNSSQNLVKKTYVEFSYDTEEHLACNHASGKFYFPF